MGRENKSHFPKRKFNKRHLNKNQNLKLYKEKEKKIDLFEKEVKEITGKYEQVNSENIEKFDDIPLSIRTKRGLKQCGYFNPTAIQKETIILSLKEHDILGAAKTGSGKTLAFVIPLLERLYVSGWSILDGLGAVIITPTRELAYQIYEVINKVGINHQFSVGLIIGGKDLAKERKLLDKCNIMICTPGRLLQHMDENPLFDAMNLKLLILDEADKILDLGFEKTMNAILENLPQERQTLLFSATQTKSVKDLARLSLKNPVYVSTDEHARHTTPESLQQSYMVCEAHDKMNLLWSFIKSHKKQKILVFMSSCKQVKFTFESICRLRPGVSLMALYGSLHQLRRMQIYDEFCKKNHVVMFATDVASRGLDFPDVSWVVQLDCPEDVNTYIHRAGRTARYKKGGESLLVLLPSEKESMVKQLTERKIPIEEIKANPNKLFDIHRKLDAILMRDKMLRESGVRGFKSYLKSIFLMKDKSVFDVSKIDVNRYASSLGLNFVPRIRFLEKHVANYRENTIQESISSKDDEQNFDSASILSEEENSKLLHADKSTLKGSLLNCDGAVQIEDDKLKAPKQSLILSDIEEDTDEPVRARKALSKAALVKRALKKGTKLNTIVKFDEDGNPLQEVGGQFVPDLTASLRRELLEEDYNLEKAAILLEKEKDLDKELDKEKIKSKHRKERLKNKEKRWLDNPAGAPPTLNESEGGSDEDQSVVDPNNISSESESDSEEEEEQLQSEQSSDEDSNEDSDEAENLSDGDKLSSSEADSSSEEEAENKSVEIGKLNMKPNKRKRQFENEESIKKEKIKQNRTLEDDEQLALHFLNI